jgi:hypothetical protein
VREGRTLASICRREPARLMPGRGFDSTRDDPAVARGDAAGRDPIDPLAMLVGKVEMTYDTDDDFVSPRLGEFIDRSNGRVTSSTGQLVTDWRRGLLTITTPRSQGVAGWLGAAGRIDLGDVAFVSRNAFGTLLAIALDDRPLARSEKILVQVGAIDRLTGFATEPVRLTWQGADYTGDRIVATGQAPWQVQRVDAAVTLKGLAGRVRSAVALDENGRARTPLTGEAAGADYVLRLPPDSLYTIIRLHSTPHP